MISALLNFAMVLAVAIILAFAPSAKGETIKTTRIEQEKQDLIVVTIQGQHDTEPGANQRSARGYMVTLILDSHRTPFQYLIGPGAMGYPATVPVAIAFPVSKTEKLIDSPDNVRVEKANFEPVVKE